MTTQHRKEIILQHHKTHTRKELAEMLGCTVNYIDQFLFKNKIKCKPALLPTVGKHHDYIVKLADTMTMTEISELIGVGYDALKCYCHRQGIKCKSDPKQKGGWSFKNDPANRLPFQWVWG